LLLESATSTSLVAAVAWGASDFCGGIGAKGTSSVGVVIVAHAAGFLGMLGLALAAGEAFPSQAALLWGVASGIGAAVGFSALYRALAVGQMGINAPVAAITTNALAVFFGIWREGLPALLQVVGFLLSLVAIYLMTVSGERSTRPKGLGLAICAGVGFSVYLISSRQAARDAVYWPIVVARATSVVVLLSYALARRTIVRPARELLGYLVLAGVLDAVGNVLFVHAVRHGRLDVATVLSSLYPGITVVLARLVLKERITKVQTVGIAVALVAVPMIASH